MTEVIHVDNGSVMVSDQHGMVLLDLRHEGVALHISNAKELVQALESAIRRAER